MARRPSCCHQHGSKRENVCARVIAFLLLSSLACGSYPLVPCFSFAWVISPQQLSVVVGRIANKSSKQQAIYPPVGKNSSSVYDTVSYSLDVSRLLLFALLAERVDTCTYISEAHASVNQARTGAATSEEGLRCGQGFWSGLEKASCVRPDVFLWISPSRSLPWGHSTMTTTSSPPVKSH